MISIDLTELISTIISSTAALVAIIGGFLVSRVITLKNTDHSYSLPSNFYNFIKDNNIKIDTRKNWYEIIYTIIYNNLPNKPSTDSIFGMQYYFEMPKVQIYKPPNIANVKWYNEKVKERNSLKDEVNILSNMKKEQRKLLNKYIDVSGLWSGLLILAYSTIVGIIVPISLLPYHLDKYDNIRTKKVLLPLFFSGLASLFIYLCVSMYKLTKDN